MNQVHRHAFAILLAGCAVASTADARYLCRDPQTRLDQRACAAAEEGPQALRRFIDRMRPIESLYFYDYVNEARLLAWLERKADKLYARKQRYGDAL